MDFAGNLSRAVAGFLDERPDIPGCSVAIHTPASGLVTLAGGLADLAGEPMTPEHTFRLASNTKTFTSAAILRLAEAGRLSIEDPVGRYFPAELVGRLCVVDGVSYGAAITLRHCLQHTSGLYDWGTDETYGQISLDEPDHRWTPLEQVEFALSHGRPTGRPGEAFSYSDTGFVLLSVVIEQVSGRPLAEALRTLLRFDDIGLSATWLETLEAVPPAAGPRVRQYDGRRDFTALDASFDLFGGGGLVAPARDLAAFWRALFGGRVFDRPATLASMLTTVPAPPRGDAGLGLFGRPFGYGPTWFHGGFWGTYVVHAPGHETTLAICSNQHRAHRGNHHEPGSEMYLAAPGLWGLATRILNAAGIEGSFA